jgi:hypothetical protein
MSMTSALYVLNTFSVLWLLVYNHEMYLGFFNRTNKKFWDRRWKKLTASLANFTKLNFPTTNLVRVICISTEVVNIAFLILTAKYCHWVFTLTITLLHILTLPVLFESYKFSVQYSKVIDKRFHH